MSAILKVILTTVVGWIMDNLDKLLKPIYWLVSDWIKDRKRKKETKKKVEEYKNASTKDSARDSFSKLP